MNVAIRCLLAERSNRVLVQVLRYTIVGGVSLVVDFGIYLGVAEIVGVHYLLANMAGFLLGLGISELVLWTSTEVVGFHHVTGKLLSSVVALSWDFGARRSLSSTQHSTRERGGLLREPRSRIGDVYTAVREGDCHRL